MNILTHAKRAGMLGQIIIHDLEPDRLNANERSLL